MLKDEIEKVLEKLYTDSLEDTAYSTNHKNSHIKAALTRILELMEKEINDLRVYTLNQGGKYVNLTEIKTLTQIGGKYIGR